VQSAIDLALNTSQDRELVEFTDVSGEGLDKKPNFNAGCHELNQYKKEDALEVGRNSID
jgi:hypothetical protein